MPESVSEAVYGSVVVPSPSLGVKARFWMKAKLRAEFQSEKAQAVTSPPAGREGGSKEFRVVASPAQHCRTPLFPMPATHCAPFKPRLHPGRAHSPALGFSTDRLMVGMSASEPEMAAMAGRVGATAVGGWAGSVWWSRDVGRSTASRCSLHTDKEAACLGRQSSPRGVVAGSHS